MIKSFAATTARAKLTEFEYPEKNLAAHDIEIQITHCGICHSDVHLIDNDWGISTYPLVPGHEIVGLIKSCGSSVKDLKVGDRVGVGWQRGACLDCEFCRRGEENLCGSAAPTCVGAHGGFAESIRLDHRFAFRIPDALKSENAAPLLCGGITVYSPLRLYDVKPHHRVGVIGIGGLGHLAIQFARAWGCEVTAFSSTEEKREEALSFGAHHFVATRDAGAVSRVRSEFDFILSTVHVDLDWNLYLSALRPNGKLCFVGVPTSAVQVPAFALIGGQKSIVGSNTGGRAMIAEMLEFAARHQIQAKSEVVPLNQVNQAVQKVRENRARYRMVLKT